MLLSGCAGDSTVDYARAYPADNSAGTTLDVQVFRRSDSLTLTNTSAQAFGPGTVWVNRAFSRPIDGLRVGQSITMSLHEFRNEYSQKFRAGGFFATEVPSSLVLCEIEHEGRFFGLVVVEDEWN